MCLAVVLTSCSGAVDRNTAGVNGVIESNTNGSAGEQVESLNLEIERLESELSAVSKELAEFSSQAEAETAQISAQLAWRESELINLQVEYDQLESERADIAKAFQQYKNEVEQYILNEQDTATRQDVSETAVEPYTTVDYLQLIDDSETYYMRHICIRGKVVQIEERNEITQVLISYGGDEDQLILLEFDKSLLARELLQLNDEIKVYGTSFGLLEVTTLKANNVRVAGIYVDLFTILE